ncbi:tripartite tricarboxylate transporter TctB family protein [Rhodoplanes sp. TEM]|uniref:Tripartite tricarboxylate transporter TctB family protein n=1 Tax=Rhodoplanes tepidamans TaxID=200616 RepID=A0ABT5JIS2_RHOTP|nr:MULTISPECIES: tripartite tricarboxylate transporter TctB family protein [Rhodoplanes]MDC7789631.1 tripartite tricarboxylate transporter TctB family protein [Rhodoplanes tepidamans]MDC7987385.1 tripartite tricarboxylate transporter TctB family protein [Rhodoplanes sp. TEM]MDQ0359178.1 putative tricarboxylic transport membrane protein [Rhodoplanes tepidamans]
MAAELVFNCLLGLLLVFYLVQAFMLPPSDNPADVLGAGGFPIILGVLGLIVLLFVTLRLLRTRTATKIPLFELGTVDGRAVAINVVLLLAYLFVLDVIGFVLATLAYLPLAGWFIGYRKPAMLAIYTVAVTASLTLVFGVLFGVPLPRGAGELRELSYLIY